MAAQCLPLYLYLDTEAFQASLVPLSPGPLLPALPLEAVAAGPLVVAAFLLHSSMKMENLAAH